MAKKFNKETATAEQLALYNEVKRLAKEIKETENQRKENFITYCKMEGKYATKTFDNNEWIEQGFRGFGYEYPNEEAKVKET
jgi:hypothetical protein